MGQDIPESPRARTIITMDLDNYSDIFKKHQDELSVSRRLESGAAERAFDRAKRIEALEHALISMFRAVKKRGFRFIPTASGGNSINVDGIVHDLVATGDKYTYRLYKIPKNLKKK